MKVNTKVHFKVENPEATQNVQYMLAQVKKQPENQVEIAKSRGK